jgi:hypothetical protein
MANKHHLSFAPLAPTYSRIYVIANLRTLFPQLKSSSLKRLMSSTLLPAAKANCFWASHILRLRGENYIKGFSQIRAIEMVKEMRYMQNWGEFAPALLISHQKYSTCPQLETIAEEGPENFELLPKRVLFLLPVLFPFLCYHLLYTVV